MFRSLYTACLIFALSAGFLAADAAPQIFYRDDQAGLASFQSYAAQAGGVENSEAVLANGDLNELMANHAITFYFSYRRTHRGGSQGIGQLRLVLILGGC